MENEAYFTIKPWRGIPEGRTLITYKKDATGLVEVSEPISKAIIHSCMVEILASIRMGLLVDIRTGDFESTKSDD
jgi:hypothetical protein